MGKLKIVQGDATKPKPLKKSSAILIAHVCNDMGMWGSGFVLAVNKAFGLGPSNAYRAWAMGDDNLTHYIKNDAEKEQVQKVWLSPSGRTPLSPMSLGEVQFVQLNDKLLIANMIGQHKVRGMDPTGRPPIRYAALAYAMQRVGLEAEHFKAEIHCPKFGSDLAGGEWKVIEEMIQEIWVDSGINVVVYEWVT